MELLPVILRKRGRLAQSAFFGLLIFIRADQRPINAFYLRHRVNNLLTKAGIGNAAIVLRFHDEAPVQFGTETLQQVLCDLRAKRGGQQGRVAGEIVVGRRARVVKGKVEQRAGGEALLIPEIASVGSGGASGLEGAVGLGRGALKLTVTTRPVLTPRKIWPDSVRRMSVSAMSRFSRAMAIS